MSSGVECISKPWVFTYADSQITEDTKEMLKLKRS